MTDEIKANHEYMKSQYGELMNHAKIRVSGDWLLEMIISKAKNLPPGVIFNPTTVRYSSKRNCFSMIGKHPAFEAQETGLPAVEVELHD